MDFWISQGFFGFFLDSSKGCLDFWVSKSKIQKNSRKKMDFCKKSNFYLHFFLIFWKNPSFSLSFFWIFDIRIGKIHLFPRFFFDFCKNPSFSLGFLLFLKIPSFSLSFFGFLTWKPKNPNTLSKNPKKIQKNLGKSKNPSF